MQITKICFSVTLLLIVTAVCVAQDADEKQDAKAKEATERAIKNATTQMMKSFAKANLTDEQKEKAQAVVKKHIGSLMEARTAQAALLTDEQKKTRIEAMAEARADGAASNKLNGIGTKAMGLTQERLNEYTVAGKKVNEISEKIHAAMTALLTNEQKALMPERGAGKTQTVALKLPNMCCGGCVAAVRKALDSVDGIADIKTNLQDQTCFFTASGDLDVKAMLDEFAENGIKQIQGWTHEKGPAY